MNTTINDFILNYKTHGANMFELEATGDNHYTVYLLGSYWYGSTEMEAVSKAIASIEKAIANFEEIVYEQLVWAYDANSACSPVAKLFNSGEYPYEYSAWCNCLETGYVPNAIDTRPVGPKYVVERNHGEGYGYGDSTSLNLLEDYQLEIIE